MSFVDQMRAYLDVDAKIVQFFTNRFFAKKVDEPNAGFSPQPMTPAPPQAVMGGAAPQPGGGGSGFHYPNAGGGGMVTASGGGGGGGGGYFHGGGMSGTSGQYLAYNGHAQVWQPALPVKVKSNDKKKVFADLNATEEAVVMNVAQFDNTELVREKDGSFSYARSGRSLGKDRVKLRTVNALIKKSYLTVVEHGERAEALVCILGTRIKVHHG